MSRRARWLLALLPGCALTGCTLVDQRTFNPDAGAPPVIPPAAAAPVAAAPPGPPPLLTLRPGQMADDAVQQAVAAARRRKPDVLFDVVAMVPAAMEDEVRPATTEAGAVARAITAQGVPASRVRLLARPAAGLEGREVRVYVR